MADDPEYWVLRVVPVGCCEGARTGVHLVSCRTHALVAAGDLHYVGGELVEPIEVYTCAEDATARAAVEAGRTGGVYKVTMVMDVDVGAGDRKRS